MPDGGHGRFPTPVGASSDVEPVSTGIQNVGTEPVGGQHSGMQNEESAPDPGGMHDQEATPQNEEQMDTDIVSMESDLRALLAVHAKEQRSQARQNHRDMMVHIVARPRWGQVQT